MTASVSHVHGGIAMSPQGEVQLLHVALCFTHLWRLLRLLRHLQKQLQATEGWV